jgi:predicted nucleic acid-binding protein
MKYVLDASVAVKWVLPESETREALSLRDDFRNQIHELIAPEIFLAEVANALTRAERRGIIRHTEALTKLMDVLTTAPDFHANGSLVLRAVEISSQARISVYDCFYLALAEREQCQLVTADQRLSATKHPQVILLASLA